MDDLQRFKEIALKTARAISEIFKDVKIVIVGQDGTIFAHSDRYMHKKKTREYAPYINTILKKHTPTIVEDPGQNVLCKGCSNEGNCPQTLEITFPFHVDDNWGGYLSLITFSEEARTTYLLRQKQVLDFLAVMIDVLIMAGREHFARLAYQKVSNALSTILQHIDYIVFSCYANGNIQSANQAFNNFFNIEPEKEAALMPNLRDLLGEENALLSAIDKNENFEDRECPIILNNKLNRMIVSCKILKKEEETPDREYLFVLRTLAQARRFISVGDNLSSSMDEIIGNSPPMMGMKENIWRFSQSISTVLIRGETGTGKELVARSLHSLSPRSNKPFVAINCAAIPDTLLESELFGYEKGTFTGANNSGKAGLFENGNGGTIFLDEIGDMPLHLQAKLLRVLQEKKVIRLGGFHPTDLDIRIVAATNQNLEQLVQEKKFRSDLFYRLNVLPIEVPALRYRLSDFNDLVFHFIIKYNAKLNKTVTGIDNDFLKILKEYHWPGNVRELENTIEYAINLAQTPTLTIDVCTPEISALTSSRGERSLKDLLRTEEMRIIRDYLQKFGTEKSGVTKTAKILGISRASLYGKIKDYQIKF